MSALDAARRFRITAKRAKDAAQKAAEANPLTSAVIGATVAGGLWLAHSLYTEEPDTCDNRALAKVLEPGVWCYGEPCEVEHGLAILGGSPALECAIEAILPAICLRARQAADRAPS